MQDLVTRMQDQLPRAANGLILPLSKSLDSSALATHQARVALELEVLAKKTDRYGWERDRGTMAHDQMMGDWIDALQDFPLEEVREGIKAAMDEKHGKMPNEREVLFQVHKARAKWLLAQPKPQAPQDPERRPATAEEARKIMEEYGFAPKRMGDRE